MSKAGDAIREMDIDAIDDDLGGAAPSGSSSESPMFFDQFAGDQPMERVVWEDPVKGYLVMRFGASQPAGTDQVSLETSSDRLPGTLGDWQTIVDQFHGNELLAFEHLMGIQPSEPSVTPPPPPPAPPVTPTDELKERVLWKGRPIGKYAGCNTTVYFRGDEPVDMDDVILTSPDDHLRLPYGDYQLLLESEGSDKDVFTAWVEGALNLTGQAPQPQGPGAPVTDDTPAWARRLESGVVGVATQLEELGGHLNQTNRRLDEHDEILTELVDDVRELKATTTDFFNNAATAVVDKMSEPGVFREAVLAIGDGRYATIDQVETTVEELGNRVTTIEKSGPSPLVIALCAVVGFILGFWLIAPIFHHNPATTTKINNVVVKTVSTREGEADFAYGVGFAIVGAGIGMGLSRSKKKTTSTDEVFWRNPVRYLRGNSADQPAAPVVVAPATPPSTTTPPPGTVVERTEVLPAPASS